MKTHLSPVEKDLFARYPRPIAHMRQQIELSRFGICLGAGVSKDFGFPMWGDLVGRIAKDPCVAGEQFIAPNAAPSQSSRTQVLFQRFRSRRLNGSPEALITADQDRTIRQAWTELVHRCLYKDIARDDEKLSHPYLREFLPIIRNAPMTVNYNFDDSLERIISSSRSQEEMKEGRGYETAWRPSTQYRSKKAVIYHPNGFLPLRLVEGFSDHLVFSEDSFADQLIASMAGHYSILLSHLSRTTCLLLGLSLEDATFKHLLRQNAKQNPGHYHYYVAYVDEKKGPPPVQQQAAVVSSNFDIYNLVTLFLKSNEVAALGRLLTIDTSALADLADAEGVPTSYCFYLSGAVGVGKTTSVGFFPSLTMYDEWTDPKHPLLLKPFTELNNEETKEVDDWVSEQFRKKNWQLVRDETGIQVVDRCQLDPLAFVSEQQRPARAAKLLASIIPKKSKRRIRAGHVIILRGDPRIMANRIRDRHKGGTEQYVADQQEVFNKIYPEGGVTRLDVRDLPPDDVVRRIARIIHLEPYSECPLHERISRIGKGELRV